MGEKGRLRAVDFHPGRQVPDGLGHTADQASAADGDDDGVQAGFLFRDLQTGRSLAGHDEFVVIGRDQGSAFLVPDLRGDAETLRHFALHDLGPQGTDRLHLDGRSCLRDDHGGRDPQHFRAVGDGLSVVSGRSADDASLKLFLREGEDLVHGAAHFEGACDLEVLELHVDPAAETAVQVLQRDQRRVVDIGADTGFSFFYFSK